jgi:hypothetical protein
MIKNSVNPVVYILLGFVLVVIVTLTLIIGAL